MAKDKAVFAVALIEGEDPGLAGPLPKGGPRVCDAFQQVLPLWQRLVFGSKPDDL